MSRGVAGRLQTYENLSAKQLDIYPIGVYNQNTPLGYVKWADAQLHARHFSQHGREVVLSVLKFSIVRCMAMVGNCSCCHKTKMRSEAEYKSLIHRLNRIEGQIRGIKGMVENNAYCTDILTQVAAANAALNAFNKELLANHIKTCVAEDILAGKTETVDDLVATLQKLMK